MIEEYKGYQQHPAILAAKHQGEIFLDSLTIAHYDALGYKTKRAAREKKAPLIGGGLTQHLVMVFVRQSEVERMARENHGGVMCLPWADVIVK